MTRVEYRTKGARSRGAVRQAGDVEPGGSNAVTLTVTHVPTACADQVAPLVTNALIEVPTGSFSRRQRAELARPGAASRRATPSPHIQDALS
jgi:hypothetical protein